MSISYVMGSSPVVHMAKDGKLLCSEGFIPSTFKSISYKSARKVKACVTCQQKMYMRS